MVAVRFIVVICMCIGTGMFCNSTKENKVSKTVEDVTGYTTIKNGEKLKKKINAIEEQQQKRVKELEEID